MVDIQFRVTRIPPKVYSPCNVEVTALHETLSNIPSLWLSTVSPQSFRHFFDLHPNGSVDSSVCEPGSTRPKMLAVRFRQHQQFWRSRT